MLVLAEAVFVGEEVVLVVGEAVRVEEEVVLLHEAVLLS